MQSTQNAISHRIGYTKRHCQGQNQTKFNNQSRLSVDTDDRQTETMTIFSYFRDHETLRKHRSINLPEGLIKSECGSMSFYKIWRIFTNHNFEVTSTHCQCTRLEKFWLAFHHLHNNPKTQIKFDNTGFNSFRSYLPKEIGTFESRQTTDGTQTSINGGQQTETEGLLFRTLGVMKRRKYMKVAIRWMDSITILP